MTKADYRSLPVVWGFAFAIVMLSITDSLPAQSCLPEGILFSSQALIDAFPVEYPGCKTIVGDVLIKEQISGGITNLKGLSQITSFGGALDIQDNAALIDLKGLEAVASIKGRLSIAANLSLETLDGLQNLTFIGESLRISSNYVLNNITALSQISSIQGDLSLAFNDVLPSLSGLSAVDSIGGHLIISDNAAIANLNGLNKLISVGKVLQISNNANLADLNGLNRLVSVGEDLIVDNNSSLATLKGLDALAGTGRFLQIVNNPSLPSLAGLEALRSIGGLLQIYNNPSLTSLSGIDSLDHAGIADLALISCEKLNDCSVRSVCDYLDINGNLASIRDNEKPCNSREAILENCNRQGVSIIPVLEKIVFFPNPTSGMVNIKGSGLENAEIKVTDSLGRLVLAGRLSGPSFSLYHLPAGLYFVELTTPRETIVEPIYRAE